MKNKYHGLACLIIFGLSLVGILVYGIFLANKMAGSICIAKPITVPDINIPDKSTMAYIDFLTSRLTDLAALKKRNLNVDLALFGFTPSLSGKDNAAMNDPDANIPALSKESVFSYALSLSFTSPKNNFCIIDNKLYKENGMLPDDGKILKIENDRVLIIKHDKKEWIYSLQQQKILKEKNKEAI